MPFNGTQQQWDEMVAKNNPVLNPLSTRSDDLKKVIDNLLQNHSHENFPDIIKEIKLSFLKFSQQIMENRILELKKIEETQSHIKREIELITDRMKAIENI